MLRNAHDWHTAQECTQHAFVKLFAAREKINDEGHLERFLMRVAKNCWLQKLRGGKTARNFEVELDLLIAATVPDNDPEMDAHDTLRRLQLALGKLSPQRRKVVEMYFFEGIKIREIAARLSIAEQTARNTLSASIIFLRNEMRGQI